MVFSVFFLNVFFWLMGRGFPGVGLKGFLN